MRLPFGIVLAGTVLLAGCNSKATVADNDPSKSWTVSRPSAGGGGAPPQTAAAGPFWGDGAQSTTSLASAGRESFTASHRMAARSVGPRMEALPVTGVSAVPLVDTSPPRRPTARVAAAPAFAQEPAADLERISGRLKVVDALVVEIGGEALRLHGVRPPAAEDRCGQAPCATAARQHLSEKADGRIVQCDRRGLAAVCQLDGNDLALGLVKAGLLRAAGEAPYSTAESEARITRTGLWSTQPSLTNTTTKP